MELLIVVAIIGLLAATVLPNVANTADSRRGREAARIVSSFVAKAQSRAVGRREWSGFRMVATNTTSSFAAVDLFLVDVPPAYRGDSFDATVIITDLGAGSRRNASPEPPEGLAMLESSGVAPSDTVRFDGRGPLFELIEAKTSGFSFTPLGSETKATDRLGYTPHNTPWPAPTPVRHTFEIFRKPVPTGTPLTLADGLAIDLYWSGVGPPEANGTGETYRRFAILSGTTGLPTAGASASVLFDGTGRLRQIVCTSGTMTNRFPATGPVFLLVGRADRTISGTTFIANPATDSEGANWQYPDSYWIGIDSLSGIAKTAECKPNPGGATEYQRLIDSQRWIRESLLTSGQ